MVAMLVTGSILSTPLAGQASFALGAAATLGGSWQIEGADVGWVREINTGPLRYASIGGRMGVFVDQNALTGGTRGLVGGLVLQTRTGLWNLADVGNESNPSILGLDVTFEGVAYGAFNTPLETMGSAWGAFSVLPGLRIGAGQQLRYGAVFGPTVFLGRRQRFVRFSPSALKSPLATRLIGR
jgi:hypothetical protein